MLFVPLFDGILNETGGYFSIAAFKRRVNELNQFSGWEMFGRVNKAATEQECLKLKTGCCQGAG